MGADHGFAALLAPVDPGFADRDAARVDWAPGRVGSDLDGRRARLAWLAPTHPAPRGRGLCGELMRTALRDAR